LTLVGNPGFAPGMFGQALDLHRDPSQYAVRPISDSVFNFGSENFTVQVWVNLNLDPSLNEQTLVEKFTGGGGPGWTLTTAGIRGFQFYYTQSAFEGGFPSSSRTNVWFDVVVERNADLNLFLSIVILLRARQRA